ncbi:MAG: response regulator [Gammaproteobacteria bacterium]|nr:response regulator [Gammaproteobacteria bacterium]
MSACILVVDDDISVRTLVSAALSSRGYEVTQAVDGRMGVAYVQDAPEHYKLILIDYRMPEIDGLAAIRVILELAPEAPVILMSTEDIQVDLDELGVREFLPKPFEAGDLIRLVERHFDHSN